MEDPKLILGEQTPPLKPLAGSLSLFDINILPERYRRRKFRFVAVLPWLVFIILLGALYPSAMSALQAQANFSIKQNEFLALQTELSDYQNASLEIESLQTEIDHRTEIRDQILASYEGLDLIGSRWSNVLFEIEASSPPGITWTLIAQQQNQIRLEGIAINYPAVLILLDSIAEIDQINSIQIQTVDMVQEEGSEFVPVEITGEPGETTNQNQSYTFSLLAIATGEGVK